MDEMRGVEEEGGLGQGGKRRKGKVKRSEEREHRAKGK